MVHWQNLVTNCMLYKTHALFYREYVINKSIVYCRFLYFFGEVKPCLRSVRLQHSTVKIDKRRTQQDYRDTRVVLERVRPVMTRTTQESQIRWEKTGDATNTWNCLIVETLWLVFIKCTRYYASTSDSGRHNLSTAFVCMQRSWINRT